MDYSSTSRGPGYFWGSPAPEVSFSVVEVCSAELTPDPVPVEIKVILDQYASVFVVPTGLPPSRQHDHSIPLLPGAQPMSV
jgi:hypothetical protein